MKEGTDYIFCISTGRSGSDYLRTLFHHVSDCRAFHELCPIGNGEAMRRYSKGDVESMRKIAQQKAEKIKHFKRGCSVYVETNHCFIKGFGWLMPEYLPEDRIGVIILNRETSKIAESLLRIGCSPLEQKGRRWITTPDTENPLVKPPSLLISPGTTYSLAYSLKFALRCAGLIWRKFFLTELQTPQWLINYELECLKWYVEETAARARAFQKQFGKIKYFEIDIEKLNSLEEVRKMLDYFACTAKESLTSVVGKSTNLKRAGPKKAKNSLPLSQSHAASLGPVGLGQTSMNQFEAAVVDKEEVKKTVSARLTLPRCIWMKLWQYARLDVSRFRSHRN